MQTSKKIKLIYDFYENDIAYDGFEQETKIDNAFDYKKILLDSVKDIMYDKNRNLKIYSWGILKHTEPKCEISFDLTKFTTKTDIKDIRKFDGTTRIEKESLWSPLKILFLKPRRLRVIIHQHYIWMIKFYF